MEKEFSRKTKTIIVVVAVIFGIALCIGAFFLGIWVANKDEVEKITLKLPIYEYTGYDGTKNLTYEYDSSFNERTLIDTYDCQFDNCNWVGSSFTEWLLYDNNYNNDGGYYIYNPYERKIVAGEFEHYWLGTDDETKVIFGAILIDKESKKGYYNFVDNKMTVPVEYDILELLTSRYVKAKNENDDVYKVFSTEGNLMSEKYTDIYTIGEDNDIFVTNTNGLYNATSYEIGYKDRIFNEDFQYLWISERVESDRYGNINYIVYIRNNNLYVSRCYLNYIDPNNDASCWGELLIDEFSEEEAQRFANYFSVTLEDNFLSIDIYDNNSVESTMTYNVDLNNDEMTIY